VFSKKRVIATLRERRTLRDRRPKRNEEERPMMDLSRTIRRYGLFGLTLALILPLTVNAAGPEDYRFPREPRTTKDGYPLPLSGKPITKTPVITRTPGAAVKKYPEHYIPFIFDIGGGTVGNLFALGVHPAELDKVFITHFHLDHVGGIFPLFDAMGWARNTPSICGDLQAIRQSWALKPSRGILWRRLNGTSRTSRASFRGVG
jgi:hypothetical protein